eukprot:TRINITY_DN3984_c0_g1_i1.p1 TRINITY_DN3984_c0_g1~~TRINITY_DN3984_c0_g1_i1.p1  ORF type:complete len:379 (-),score=61.37 TRINITY_DN3984_c0_g1_i1:11-1012(-)
MDHDYPSFCELPPTSQTCTPQLSLINYFYPDGGPVIRDVDKTVLSLANDIASKFFFDRNFSPTNRISKYTRSSFKFGLPLKGYRNADDRKTEQYEKFVKFARRVSKNLDKLDLDDGGALAYYAAGDVLTDASINTQILKDMLLVSASIVVVFLLVWWYTWSFFLAMMAMCQILFTFPVSYAIYKMFGYEYFTALNFVGALCTDLVHALSAPCMYSLLSLLSLSLSLAHCRSTMYICRWLSSLSWVSELMTSLSTPSSGSNRAPFLSSNKTFLCGSRGYGNAVPGPCLLPVLPPLVPLLRLRSPLSPPSGCLVFSLPLLSSSTLLIVLHGTVHV